MGIIKYLPSLLKILQRKETEMKNPVGINPMALDARTGNTMTMTDWESLKHFSSIENWGIPLMMNRAFMFTLDAYRKNLNVPFIIHCGWATKGHTKKSQHYLGRAVDGHPSDLLLMDAFVSAIKFNFNGIGLYPFASPHGFLHLDNRILKKNEKRKIWWRDKKGTYHNVNTFHTLGIIHKDCMATYFTE